MTLVKICGLRDPETALDAAKAGADFIGLVFAESKRRVTPQECHDVVEALKEKRTQGRDAEFDGPQRGEVSAGSWFPAWADAIELAIMRFRPLIVGVFADQSVSDVNEIAEAAGLDLVQLSGDEDDAFVARIERPVIRTVHVQPQTTAFDINDAAPAGYSAAVLLDTGGKDVRGGTGEAFDWDVAAEVAHRTPFFLAGGLTHQNVDEAVRQVRPWAVDVSSGVETGGKKDIEKIRAFIRAAKGARVGN
jgi:phosphoribosylanthranilate isomerase